LRAARCGDWGCAANDYPQYNILPFVWMIFRAAAPASPIQAGSTHKARWDSSATSCLRENCRPAAKLSLLNHPSVENDGVELAQPFSRTKLRSVLHLAEGDGVPQPQWFFFDSAIAHRY